MVEVNATAKKIIANVEQVIVGKRQQIILSLVAWFSEGHILLEDVPGVAKTMLARALAASVGCSFKRIQCTPDLLPTDVTGVSIFNQKTTEFEFRPGPIFAQIVLADEINRATPRTQAALLEAMAEGRVTVDGKTYPLAPPFLVIGTQNPIDHEGTFPLPEAQLDRFLMRFSLGYPSLEEELKMLDMLQRVHPVGQIKAVATADELLACQTAVREVHVDEKVRRYVLQIVQGTARERGLGAGSQPAGVAGDVPRVASDRGDVRAQFRAARRREARCRADLDAPPDPAAREPAAKNHRRRRDQRSRRRRPRADPRPAASGSDSVGRRQ